MNGIVTPEMWAVYRLDTLIGVYDRVPNNTQLCKLIYKKPIRELSIEEHASFKENMRLMHMSASYNRHSSYEIEKRELSQDFLVECQVSKIPKKMIDNVTAQLEDYNQKVEEEKHQSIKTIKLTHNYEKEFYDRYERRDNSYIIDANSVIKLTEEQGGDITSRHRNDTSRNYYVYYRSGNTITRQQVDYDSYEKVNSLINEGRIILNQPQQLQLTQNDLIALKDMVVQELSQQTQVANNKPIELTESDLLFSHEQENEL